MAAGVLGSFGHSSPGLLGTFAALADVGETGCLGSVMLCRGTGAEEIGIVDHTGPCCWSTEAAIRARIAAMENQSISRLQVDRAHLAALVLLQLIRNALVLIERAHAGALDRGNMDKRIGAAVIDRIVPPITRSVRLTAAIRQIFVNRL